MAWVVAALALGGFTLFNLAASENSAWVLDPQQRLQNVVGNKNADINYKNLMTYWKPLYDPRQFQATWTYAKKVKARTDAVSSNPIKRRSGQRDIMKYNYRQGSGYGVAPNRAMEVRWA